jgi:hypothetical protein
MQLGMLLSAFVDAQGLDMVQIEKALVELTRNSLDSR